MACAVLLAAIATACGERREPTGASVPNTYPVTVQAANDTPVEIPHAPATILPVSASAAAIVDALGLRALVPGAPAAGPLRPFPVRAVAKTPADLVLGSQANDANVLTKAGSAANTPVLIVADSSIADLERSILEVGLATDTSVQARTLVKEIDARLAEVKAKLKGTDPVSVFVDTGFFIPVGDDTFAGELLRAAGARNIAGAAEQAPFAIDDLLADEPDFYLATEASGATLDGLRATKRIRNLAAIREGRFAIVPASLFQPGPGIGDAILQLYGILHPDAATTTG